MSNAKKIPATQKEPELSTTHEHQTVTMSWTRLTIRYHDTELINWRSASVSLAWHTSKKKLRQTDATPVPS